MEKRKLFRRISNLEKTGLSRIKHDVGQLEDMIRAYNEFCDIAEKKFPEDYQIKDRFDLARDMLSKYRIHEVDIQAFHEKVDDYRQMCWWLSAMMQECLEKKIFFHSMRPIGGLCAFLKDKEVTIEGETGCSVGYMLDGAKINIMGDSNSDLGEKMESGEITVEGNASSHTGANMRGGKIEIMGNSDIRTGYRMKGGTVIVHGLSDHYAGHGMVGGRLILNNAKSMVGHYIRKGDIYVLGDLDGIGKEKKGGMIHTPYGKVGKYGHLDKTRKRRKVEVVI